MVFATALAKPTNASGDGGCNTILSHLVHHAFVLLNATSLQVHEKLWY